MEGNLKLVAKELASIKAQDLMIQKGRTRGTYYVPSEKLLETSQPRELMSQPTGLISQPTGLISQPQELISQPQAVTGTPRLVMSTVQTVTGTVQDVMMTPLAVNTTPPAANTTPPTANTIPLPRDLEKDLAKLKGKALAEVLSCLIVRLCSCCPMTNEMLQTYLKRDKVTINKLVAPLIGKRIDYLYTMMPHHPRQAYVAKAEVGASSENEQVLRNLVQTKMLYSEGYGRGTVYHILQNNESAIATNNGMGPSSGIEGPSSGVGGPSSGIEGPSSDAWGLRLEVLNRGRRDCLLLLLDGGDMSAVSRRSQLNRNNATKFRHNILIPLIKAGFVISTMQPLQHPRQKYRITDVGRQYMVREGQTPLTQ